ncbi:hypothetical protein PV327_011636, partial [Microctonus hyperodae]
MRTLVEYCEARNLPLIMGCDANAHHETGCDRPHAGLTSTGPIYRQLAGTPGPQTGAATKRSWLNGSRNLGEICAPWARSITLRRIFRIRSCNPIMRPVPSESKRVARKWPGGTRSCTSSAP